MQLKQPTSRTKQALTDTSSPPVYCCFAVACDVRPCVGPYVPYLYCCLCSLLCGRDACGCCHLHCACHARPPQHSQMTALNPCCGSAPHHEGAICHFGRQARLAAPARLSSEGDGSCLRWMEGCCLLGGMRERGTGRVLSPLQEMAGQTAHRGPNLDRLLLMQTYALKTQRCSTETDSKSS